MVSTFCVATTDPVTLATNMVLVRF
jgi:hypothetical protein